MPQYMSVLPHLLGTWMALCEHAVFFFFLCWSPWLQDLKVPGNPSGRHSSDFGRLKLIIISSKKRTFFLNEEMEKLGQDLKHQFVFLKHKY